MSGYPAKLRCVLGEEGGSEPGCSLRGVRTEIQWSHVLLCRDRAFYGGLSSFVNAWKNNFPVKCTLFCHFVLVERNHSWCNLKWQNHYRSVMKNASDFLVFSLWWCLLSAAELCTFQMFCRINLMDQGSEIWMGTEIFCRQLKLSLGSVHWASSSPQKCWADVVCQKIGKKVKIIRCFEYWEI